MFTAIENLNVTAEESDLRQCRSDLPERMKSPQCLADLEIGAFYARDADQYSYYSVEANHEGNESLIISPRRKVELFRGTVSLESRYLVQFDADGGGTIVEARSRLGTVEPTDFNEVAHSILLEGGYRNELTSPKSNRTRVPGEGEVILSVQRFDASRSLENWANHKLALNETAKVQRYLYLRPADRAEFVKDALKQMAAA